MSEENKPYLIINKECDEIQINIKRTKPYMKLQQENQQLKEEAKDEEQWRIKIARENDGLYKECLNHIQENKLYKEVIEEVREYINSYDVFKEFSFPLMKREEENQIKSSIKYEFDTSIKKEVLQILDKVKENKNENR